jgi:putative ABC transport system permease protein
MTGSVRQWPLAEECRQGWQNLLVYKLRTFLTMLGMVFGVAAVVTMVSIGAGAQREVMAYIEELGVRNLIVEAREATDPQALTAIRRTSPGLTLQDLRMLRASVSGLEHATARKRFVPTKVLPKPTRDVPVVYGVDPTYEQLSRLRVTRGRFFTADDLARAAPVCVLGAGARESLFGTGEAVGSYVKVAEQWFRVIGELQGLASITGDVGGVPAQDRNNVIFVPTTAALLRLEDTFSRLKDDIDGIYLGLDAATSPVAAAAVVRSVLEATHRGAGDYTLVVPAELIAEQERTRRVFDIVMVALASISLLVGGIGIMNIMLASVVERTREIGVRRAVGARYGDIVRQFLIETLMICFAGGAAGLLCGIALSKAVAVLAGWSTVITAASVVLAFTVSVTVGVVFGLYPALRAARLDPVVALHNE